MITVKLGARIKELRQSKGLSQEKLGLAAGLDRTYIAGVESGKRNISVRSLEKIILALKISFHELFKNL